MNKYAGRSLNLMSFVPGSPQRTVLNTKWVTIYILPEPVIKSNGVRLGDYLNCELVHNDYTSFEGYLETPMEGDHSSTLFRGIAWAIDPAKPIIQGTTLQYRMTINQE